MFFDKVGMNNYVVCHVPSTLTVAQYILDRELVDFWC